jgi:hypothetical protein
MRERQSYGGFEMGQKTAEDWLREYLHRNGTTNVETIRADAKMAGIRRKDLRAAKVALGVETVNDWAANGETQNWFWSLPEER